MHEVDAACLQFLGAAAAAVHVGDIDGKALRLIKTGGPRHEPGERGIDRIGEPGLDSDARPRRLLRPRREWPGCRSAERGYELPSTDFRCHLIRPQPRTCRSQHAAGYHASKWGSVAPNAASATDERRCGFWG